MDDARKRRTGQDRQGATQRWSAGAQRLNYLACGLQIGDGESDGSAHSTGGRERIDESTALLEAVCTAGVRWTPGCSLTQAMAIDHPYSMHPDVVDELLSILASRDCRATVAYLRRKPDAALHVSRLAEELSQNDTRPPDRLASRLHCGVLPRLDVVGVIEYNDRTNTVRYEGHSELEELFDAFQRVVQPWELTA